MSGKVHDPYPLYRPAGIGPSSKNDSAIDCIRPVDAPQVPSSHPAASNASRHQALPQEPPAGGRQDDRPLRQGPRPAARRRLQVRHHRQRLCTRARLHQEPPVARLLGETERVQRRDLLEPQEVTAAHEGAARQEDGAQLPLPCRDAEPQLQVRHSHDQQR